LRRIFGQITSVPIDIRLNLFLTTAKTMEPSKILVTLGSVILLAGLILTYLPWLLNWFGKLPGDIKIQNEHSFIFIPI
jgi:hypothetical protein